MKKLSYDELDQFDREGRFVELIDGTLYNHPAPGIPHQTISSNLYLILAPYVRRRKLGRIFYAPVDVILSRFDVIQPDLIFILSRNLGKIWKRGIEGTPDLIVEIISDFTRSYDRDKKRPLYATYKVRHLWLIDPDERLLEVFEFVGNRYRLKGVYTSKDSLRSPLFPGLTIRCANIFEGV